MKIFGAPLSPFVRKALAVADLKGLAYENINMMPGSTEEEYRRISPLGKIPALTDGDFSACDSSIICEYLEEKYPQHAVLPASPEDRARSRWLEEFGDTRLVECTGVFFFERIVKGVMGAGESDEARLENLLAEEVPLRLSYVESVLPGEGFFFDEIGLGVADLAIVNPLINGGYGGLDISPRDYPKTVSFLQRVKEHPVMVARLAEEAAIMGR